MGLIVGEIDLFAITFFLKEAAQLFYYLGPVIGDGPKCGLGVDVEIQAVGSVAVAVVSDLHNVSLKKIEVVVDKEVACSAAYVSQPKHLGIAKLHFKYDGCVIGVPEMYAFQILLSKVAFKAGISYVEDLAYVGIVKLCGLGEGFHCSLNSFEFLNGIFVALYSGKCGIIVYYGLDLNLVLVAFSVFLEAVYVVGMMVSQYPCRNNGLFALGELGYHKLQQSFGIAEFRPAAVDDHKAAVAKLDGIAHSTVYLGVVGIDLSDSGLKAAVCINVVLRSDGKGALFLYGLSYLSYVGEVGQMHLVLAVYQGYEKVIAYCVLLPYTVALIDKVLAVCVKIIFCAFKIAPVLDVVACIATLVITVADELGYLCEKMLLGIFILDAVDELELSHFALLFSAYPFAYDRAVFISELVKAVIVNGFSDPFHKTVVKI